MHVVGTAEQILATRGIGVCRYQLHCSTLWNYNYVILFIFNCTYINVVPYPNLKLTLISIDRVGLSYQCNSGTWMINTAPALNPHPETLIIKEGAFSIFYQCLIPFLVFENYRLYVAYEGERVMSSIKRKKIRSLPVRVRHHVPGQKSEIIKHDLMSGTTGQDFESDEVKAATGLDNATYTTGETPDKTLRMDDQIENDFSETSGYSYRTDKCFTAWSNIIGKSVEISCEIEGNLMSSVVCCACTENVGEIRCLDCSRESTYCQNCAKKIHREWSFWTHSLEIKKVCVFII